MVDTASKPAATNPVFFVYATVLFELCGNGRTGSQQGELRTNSNFKYTYTAFEHARFSDRRSIECPHVASLYRRNSTTRSCFTHFYVGKKRGNEHLFQGNKHD